MISSWLVSKEGRVGNKQVFVKGIISFKTDTSGLNFINVLCTAFIHADPECAKKTVKSAVSFGAFGTYERKS